MNDERAAVESSSFATEENLNLRAFGERAQGVYVASPGTEVRGSAGDTGSRLDFDYLCTD